MAMTNYERNRIQDLRYGDGVAYVRPGTVYLALFTATPTVAGGGTEVSGGSYARKAITNDLANFADAIAGGKSNAIAQTFAQATAAWGIVGWVALFDALVAGNMQDFAALAATKNVQNGDVVQFAIGSLVFSLT